MFPEIIEQSQKLLNTSVESCISLRSHASARQYYRIVSGVRSMIAVANDDLRENRAFVEFARHFKGRGVPVPEVYAVSGDYSFYIMEDLGDVTLYDELQRQRGDSEEFPESITQYYRDAMRTLARIHTVASEGIDYSHCHLSSEFDVRGMRYDMNTFQTELLDQVGVKYSSSSLKEDFDRLIDFLAGARRDYFMYRDFQARNIMIKDEKLYFIDFQGGRKGPAEYDVVSLLYQSQAQIPESIRSELLNEYLDELEQLGLHRRKEFLTYYDGFVFLRIMQVLGVYGKAGLREGKEYFRNGIPHAISILNLLIEEGRLPVAAREFSNVVAQLTTYDRELNVCRPD